jgi:hypothetical protein
MTQRQPWTMERGQATIHTDVKQTSRPLFIIIIIITLLAHEAY